MGTGLRSRRVQVRILLRALVSPRGDSPHANVAQWLARLSDKQEVGGSNPPVRTVTMVQDQGAGV